MIRFTRLTRLTRLTALVAVLALSAFTPLAARAQSSSSMELNLGAGLALPTGSFGDRNDAGYNLIVGIGTMPRSSQLGFRAEGIYTEYAASNTSGGRKSHAGGITGNAIFDLSQGNRATTNSLFLIGGIGYYQTKEEFFQFSGASENNIGFNIGGGFRFPLSGFSAYLEARYHTVQNTDVKFIPITFGLVF